jgi:hypothetical protein
MIKMKEMRLWMTKMMKIFKIIQRKMTRKMSKEDMGRDITMKSERAASSEALQGQIAKDTGPKKR